MIVGKKYKLKKNWQDIESHISIASNMRKATEIEFNRFNSNGNIIGKLPFTGNWAWDPNWIKKDTIWI